MVWTISREKKSKFFIFLPVAHQKIAIDFVCVDKWLSLQNWLHRVSYILPILWVCVLLRLIGSSYSAFVFPRLSPCLGFLPLHLSFCFFHNLLQPTLVFFFNSFESALSFESLEEHYVPKHYFCTLTLISLCVVPDTSWDLKKCCFFLEDRWLLWDAHKISFSVELLSLFIYPWWLR